VASQVRVQSRLSPCLRCPPPPPPHEVEHGNSSGQPAQGRQSDADIVPQAPQPPPGWGASEPAFSARDAHSSLTMSQNLVLSEFKIPRPFPFAVHGGTVAAPVAGIKYCQVAEKGELS